MIDFDETPHRDDFFVSDNPDKLDLPWVTNTLLGTYWGKGLTKDKIIESLRNSLCFGLYAYYLTSKGGQHEQIGFARVVTDHATFAWLCDVVIDPDYRKRGLGKFLVATVVNDPRIRHTVINLGTSTAQGLYTKFGFETVERMRRIPS